jgi:signal transduction histidine kinase
MTAIPSPRSARRAAKLILAVSLATWSLQVAAAQGDPSGTPDQRQQLVELLDSGGFARADLVDRGRAAASDAAKAGDESLRSLALSVQCRGLIQQGLLDEATPICREALRRAPAGDDLALSAAQRMNGVLTIERGQPLAALPTLIEANAAAGRSGNARAIAASLMSLGAAAQWAGVNADAVDYYDRALTVATGINANELAARIANNLGVLLLERGDAEGARLQFQTAIDRAARVGDRGPPSSIQYGLAFAEIQSDRSGDAIERLRALLAAGTPGGAPLQHADGMLYLARAEYRLGNLEAAEAAVRRSLEQLRQLNPARSYPAAALLVDVLVTAGKIDAAQAVLRPLLRDVPADALGRVELLEAQERLLAAQGRYREAYVVAGEVRQARARQSSAESARTLAFLRVRSEAQQREQELNELRIERARVDREAATAKLVRNFSLVLLAAALLGAWALWGLMRTRRKLETEVERRRSHEALAKLTGGVAHDFNNLMTIMQQTMNLLRREANFAHSPSAMSLIREAEEAAKLGGRITWQLLTFAKQNQLRPELMDLGTFFNDRRTMFDKALGERMQLRIDNPLPATDSLVRVDPVQLTTCLINLLSNARDAMQSTGEVVMRARSVENVARTGPWTELPPGRYVAISVVDTGCGMSADVLEQSTTPFFTTKGVSGGTGLGLSAAQGFAAQSGGRLQIESAPGAGTTVTLVLPVNQDGPHTAA